MRRLTVALPHGFCSGVSRAVRTAHAVLSRYPGETVYCLHEIVHNGEVVASLSRRGMVFVQRVADVPDGARILFSAHGVSPSVREEARSRSLRVVDATCPFVARVHAEVRRHVAEGRHVFCIGHRNHDEVAGVAGEAPGHVTVVENADEAAALAASDRPAAVVTQTTLGLDTVERALDVLRTKFPALLVPPSTEVCYATCNRQAAVRALSERCSHVLVLGSKTSSNSLRLVETAAHAGIRADLVSTLADLAPMRWDETAALGITSGASTPETFLNEALDILQREKGFPPPEFFEAVPERECSFKLPCGLEDDASTGGDTP